MKLTRYLRAAYVRAALDDIPTVDYDELIRKTVYDIVVASLPEPMRAFLNSEHGHFMAHDFFYAGEISISVPCSRHHCTTLYGQIDLAVASLRNARLEQDNRCSELYDKLSAVANSCTTTEALARALPDFAKYIPKPEPKVAMPVAVTGVLEAFKAAGWPKEVA